MAFRHICRGPGVKAKNSTCATLVCIVPLITSELYCIVTFSLLLSVLIILSMPLNYKKKYILIVLYDNKDIHHSTFAFIQIKKCNLYVRIYVSFMEVVDVQRVNHYILRRIMRTFKLFICLLKLSM